MALVANRWLAVLLTLGLGVAQANEPPPSISIHADGLGAFRLGAPLVPAARKVAALDRAALQIGPGCDERDQSVVTVAVAGSAMTVMAMAGAQGHIAEVVASAPHQGPAVSEASCQGSGQRWARTLALRLGPGEPLATVAQGASRVAKVRFKAGAQVEARWFPGGGSCDLSLHFVRSAVAKAAR